MNRIKIFLLISFPFFLILSCSSQKKVKEINQDSVHAMNKKNLPVGMVELSMVISEIIDRNDSKFCLARIMNVHAYGNSVKALAEGIEYEFVIDESLVKEMEQLSIVSDTIRCKLVKVPGGMDLNSPDKLKIISIVN